MKMMILSIQQIKELKKNDPSYPGPGWLHIEYDQFLMKTYQNQLKNEL